MIQLIKQEKREHKLCERKRNKEERAMPKSAVLLTANLSLKKYFVWFLPLPSHWSLKFNFISDSTQEIFGWTHQSFNSQYCQRGCLSVCVQDRQSMTASI